MSETVTTFAFGSAHARNGGPRFIRVFGELVVGGSGVYIFHALAPTSVRPIRIRPTSATEAQVLMSGLVLADTGVPLDGPVAELATSLRASEQDIELTAEDGSVLADAAANIAVSVMVTGVGHQESVRAEDFAGTDWTVLTATVRRSTQEHHGLTSTRTAKATLIDENADHAMCEYHVVPALINDMARRDSSAAQRTFTMMLSNWVGRDGFHVEYGLYDQALSIEIPSEDGRRLVIAPLFKWEQGDAFELDWEWALKGPDAQFLEHPDEDPDLATIWGSREIPPDLAEGIGFYREAIDEAARVAGFRPVSSRERDEPVQHWQDFPS